MWANDWESSYSSDGRKVGCELVTHFPAVGSDRFDEALGGIRGAKLDAAKLESLRNRLAQLLSTGESGRALEATP